MISSPLLPVLLIGGCLIDRDLYEERLEALTDDDGDGFTEDGGDCDDNDPDSFPGADEACNGEDNNCDGFIDNEPVDGGPWYFDDDGDEYGAIDTEVALCDSPGDGWLLVGGDCDDDDANIHPAAEEVCDGIDNDCSGEADDDAVDGAVWYNDDDGDGYGDDSDPNKTCEDTDGLLLTGGDCDDTNADVNPDGVEVCNDRLDNDCDGTVNHCTWEEAIELSEQIQIEGLNEPDGLGYSGGVGDLNGDGENELIFSGYATYNKASEGQSGAVFVFELPIVESLDRNDASFTVWGEPDLARGFGSGTDVGDIDGDGYDDLLVGAHSSTRNEVTRAGAGFVFYGPITGDLEAEDADWTLEGEVEHGRLGRRAHLISDLNGDHVPDFGLAHEWGDYGGIESAGILWLFTDAQSGTAFADSEAEAIIYGTEEYDYLGRSYAGLDFDGDGENELVVGADQANDYDGEAYLFDGAIEGLLSNQNADATWVGEERGGAGRKLASLGDTNEDGYEDVLVGADGTGYGAAYILWGSAKPETMRLADADITLRSSGLAFQFGFTVHNVGDLNDDGAVEIVLGEAVENYSNGYVFFGPFDTRQTLEDQDADVILYGDWDDEDYELFLGPGDVTGDDVPDLVVGSYLNEGAFGESYAGMVYIVPGIGL